MDPSSCNEPHPFCLLPGDPSLILTTNVDLGDKKMEIMKACSKAICASTGKPESYIAVSITDKADVIFGGSDAPTALGCLYSIGAIGMESNGQITAAVTDLLAPFGVDEARIYINFFDMPRANVGWSRRTFAG
ncbi:phenylpyruvate tautomerase [Fistulifera solaris]|uniref:L-dopachrome isomerase n=1 Tax=Fistulifera solaris TaxID=1519565 RepID=A0A1Z5JYI9_FISSO|nr:phenylpyruvate tautomerase [Fistulifera solaris]|eukprot:GAX18969.1 phenylpyruvate tautomerase [Fistulifera solaris]